MNPEQREASALVTFVALALFTATIWLWAKILIG